jgi:hypothetical protein
MTGFRLTPAQRVVLRRVARHSPASRPAGLGPARPGPGRAGGRRRPPVPGGPGHGVSYWLDEAEIEWADGITARVNEGLRRSRFVVVFLSDAFVGRGWPEAELGAALSRENAEGRKVVLPVVLGEAGRILANYPLLRDKAHLHWDLGVPALADALQRLADRPWSAAELDQFIRDRVDLAGFRPDPVWGPGYRLLASRGSAGEGVFFFWNERRQVVERHWKDGVRWQGPEPLTADDVRLVRAAVGGPAFAGR